MSWAGRRRAIILFVIGVFVIAFLSVLSIATFYDAPSCSDNKQNQGEVGIDCGGPCSFLCSANEQSPTVLFTKAIDNGAGRIDVVSVIDNKNAFAAAKNVSYKISVYGASQKLLREIQGMTDLPPGSTVPVFVPGAYVGKEQVTSAFLTITSTVHWYSLSASNRMLPVVTSTKQSGTSNAPRISGTLMNPTPLPMNNVLAIVFVHDELGEIIAASQTLVPYIAPQSSATAIFTWNAAFSRPVASIEILPVIPL